MAGSPCPLTVTEVNRSTVSLLGQSGRRERDSFAVLNHLGYLFSVQLGAAFRAANVTHYARLNCRHGGPDIFKLEAAWVSIDRSIPNSSEASLCPHLWIHRGARDYDSTATWSSWPCGFNLSCGTQCFLILGLISLSRTVYCYFLRALLSYKPNTVADRNRSFR